MAANALIQTRIDAGDHGRKLLVLEGEGLKASDVVRILLTGTTYEGAFPLNSR